MSIKQQIQEKQNQIRQLEREYDKSEDRIRDLEREQKRAGSDADFGLGLFSSPTTRPLGLFEASSALDKVKSISTEIKKEYTTESDIASEIAQLEVDIHLLEQEYSKIKESQLIAKKDGIYIEGDKEEFDILLPLRNKMESYAKQHNAIKDSKDIQAFLALKAKLMQFAATHKVPELNAGHHGILAKANFKIDDGINYIILDNKYFVDSDAVEKNLVATTGTVRRYNRQIEQNRQRMEDFKPTFWGKVFSSVRKKEEKELQSDIDFQEATIEIDREEFDEKLRMLTEIKERYIDPCAEIKEEISQICALKRNSEDVQNYLRNTQKYERPVSPETIFKDMGIENVGAYILSLIQPHLDDNDLKVSKERILEAIYSSKYHKALAEQIQKHMGHTSPKATVQQVEKGA